MLPRRPALLGVALVEGGVLGFALDAVMAQINAMKDGFTSQKLWRPAGLAQPAKVQERWAFRNLLGAMYLQMYWLLAEGEKNVARCENCGKLISLSARAQSDKEPFKFRKVRSDKNLCSKRGWRQDYYERKEKDRHRTERERSALVRKAQRLVSRSSKTCTPRSTRPWSRHRATGWCRGTRSEGVKPPRPRKKEIHPRAPEQACTFLEAARRARFEALFVLALHCGLREGELLGLKWDDVDLEAGTL